jgi:glycosyltransferase involved in cell wall biosynthesis
MDLMASLGDAAPEVERHLIAGYESGPLLDRARQAGVQTHRVEIPPRLSRLGESALYSRGKLSALARLAAGSPLTLFDGYTYSRSLHRKIAELKPDIVHSNAMKSHLFVSAGGLKTCPLVWHVRDFLRTRPLMIRLLRMVSSSASRAIGISEAVAKDIRESLPGLPVEVMYDGINVDLFTPGPGNGEELDRLAGLPPAASGTVRVGLVATYARWKGHDLLIEAASRIATQTPFRVYIIGGPIYTTKGSQFSEEELRSLVSRHGLEDRIGFIPFQPDPAEIYRSLDIVVHTSTKPEPYGRTIVEAMAASRPVVISNDGGAAELFREGFDGVGFTLGSADSLSGAIARLIDDPATRERLASNARNTAIERFHRDRLGSQVLRLYESVLEGRRSS